MIIFDYISDLMGMRFSYARAGGFDSDDSNTGSKPKKAQTSSNYNESENSNANLVERQAQTKVEPEIQENTAVNANNTPAEKFKSVNPSGQRKTLEKFFKPINSVFKRVEKDYLNNTFGRIITAKTSFYGKPFMVHILAKDIVRYNAKMISEKLRISNTKYCLQIKKLIDSCMANARYFGIDDSKMCIKTLHVGRGKYLKRREFKGRGRSGVIWRPYSNVKITLQEVNFG